MRYVGLIAMGLVAASCALPSYEFSSVTGTGGAATGGGGGDGTTGGDGGSTGGSGGVAGGGGATGGAAPGPTVQWAWTETSGGDRQGLEIAAHVDGTSYLMVQHATSQLNLQRIDSMGNGQGSINVSAMGSMLPGGLDVDGNGDVLAAATFLDQVGVLGLPMMPGIGTNDVALVGFDGALSPQYVRVFGGLGTDSARALTADASGGVTVCGLYATEMDVNGESLPAESTPGPFMVRVDAATGSTNLSLSSISVFGDHGCDAVAATDNASVVVVGSFDDGGGVEDVRFDGVASLNSTGGRDAYVALYDDQGVYGQWAIQLGGSGDVFPQAVSVRDTTVAVTGYFTGQLEVYPTSGPITRNAEGEDVFLVLVDLIEREPELFAFGGPANQKAWGVALAAQQNQAYVVGEFAGAISVDMEDVTGQGQDAFVARVGQGGPWLLTFGGPEADSATDVDVNAQGIFVSGYAEGSVSAGGVAFVAPNQDPFVLKLIEP